MFEAEPRHGKLDAAARRAHDAGLFGRMWVARILVIDDEPLVAMMVQRTLEPVHEVSVEHGAKTALARMARGERWDAIVADLHLPEGDGIWLRQQLTSAHPEMVARLLILTGGAATEAARAFLAQPGIRWLQKPFRGAELLSAVDDLLASPG
jgi:DNA-binding response OmpR family regulator